MLSWHEQVDRAFVRALSVPERQVGPNGASLHISETQQPPRELQTEGADRS